MKKSDERKQTIEALYGKKSTENEMFTKAKKTRKKGKSKAISRGTYSRVKRKRRTKIRKWVWIFMTLISLFLFVFSGFKIFNWVMDSKQTKKQDKEIRQNIKVEEVPVSESDEMINPPDNKDNDYWKYMSLPLINVDFNELKGKNSETVAFLKVNGTNINYPVVQTSNNSYYLTHSYDRSKNDAGWVFLDYRNDIDNLQDNTIIYAHGRYDTTMFGSLKNVFKNNWYENTENYVVYLSTPNYNTLWQVFSVYSIPTETYYLTSSFGSIESHQRFIDTIISRSKFNFNASVDTNDKVLTLSTCYNTKEKVVLHAKLIKRVSK